jgi:hypothetical protein
VSGAPKLRAAGLWEKTSTAGRRYFVGRLGGVRILILENRPRGSENQPDFELFFVDGERREAPAAPASTATQGHEPRRQTPYRPRQTARPPIRPDSVLPDNDDISDIGRRSR